MKKISLINQASLPPQTFTNAPFSQERLNEIFRTSPQNPDRLITRENSWLEFKQNFNWKSRDDYARTFAAFANTNGGYVIFGVQNKPHLLLGINPDDFYKIDPAIITGELNNYFAPEIAWENRIIDVQGKSFGIIYIYESKEKPVIATKNGDNITEGQIYYRYRGRTEKIRYAELRHILDEQRRIDQELLLKHLAQIKKYGVANVGIFDLKSGAVTGPNNSFIIDKSLLPQLKFIKEGHFHETDGLPTLKLIGELKSGGKTIIQPTKDVERIRAIRTADIIEDFLNQIEVKEPKEYIKQICFESSGTLPVYFYMYHAGLSKADTISMINEIRSRYPGRTTLLKRIETEEDLYIKSPVKQTEQFEAKLVFKNQILQQKISENLGPKEMRFALQAVRMISKRNLNQKYVFSMLKKWFQSHYTIKGKDSIAMDLRYAICYVDRLLFRDKIKEK